MNNMNAPFTVSVGQVLKVPDLASVNANNIVKPEQPVAPKVAVNNISQPVPEKQAVPKISSDPTKQLPKIATRSSSKFSWPVRGRVISEYGAKSNGLFNDGINIASAKGTSVKAAENGVVAYAGNEVKGMGNLIIIQHSDGWMTVYAHMDSMGVKRGNKVTVGQKIGTVGTSGKVDEPQLHFEVRKGTKAYNPTQYLKN
ncbi:MAG: M23 family metallopeptidase [Proteobacteria bacterium]|nr:M23 family metallopeptidase [Candidatus Enterousia scatequi]